jgi:hemerythrin superfamily protein
METSMTSATKSNTQKQGAQDAITLLTDDHKTVDKLFKDYDKLKEADGSSEDRAALAKQICAALIIHAQIEEEIFYPAAREAIEDGDVMDEAEVEHAGAKELITQLGDMSPEDELYDAKVTVLGEYIRHHVNEEQDEMFPKVEKAKVDTASLGAELLQRKQELQAEMKDADGADESEGDAAATPRSPGRKTPARTSR